MGAMSPPGSAAEHGWLADHHLGALQIHRHRTGASAPDLSAHEHVLIREFAPEGAEHIGTDRALYLHDGAADDTTWRRIGWPEVACVDWSRATNTVTLRTWPQQGDPSGAAVTLHIKEHSRLPEFATERMMSCRLVNRRVRISEHCAATISAHRDPGHGRITWTVFVDGDRDRYEPAIARAIERELAELRAQFGC